MNSYLTLFRMHFLVLLIDGREQKDSLPIICHRYPTMMKIGTVNTLPKEDLKNV